VVAAIIEKQRPGVDKAPLVGVVLDADVVQAEPLDHAAPWPALSITGSTIDRLGGDLRGYLCVTDSACRATA